MKKLQITQKETVDKMVQTLLDRANAKGITLPPVNDVNELDDIFNDGGEARCEHFADIAWDYALQFGKFESDKFDAAQWSCIENAITKLNKSLPPVTLYIGYIASGYVYGMSDDENAGELGYWALWNTDISTMEFALVEITINNLTPYKQQVIDNLLKHGTSEQVYSDGYIAASWASELSKRFRYIHKGSQFYW
jgi:hypothetical protein